MRIRGGLLAAGAALAVAAIVAMACSGGGGGDDTPPERPTSVPADAPFIDQNGLRFRPNAVSAKPGRIVYFANSESSIHTVTINGKNESGTMKRGTIFEWTAGAAGAYQVTCDYHPQMKATINVTE